MKYQPNAAVNKDERNKLVQSSVQFNQLGKFLKQYLLNFSTFIFPAFKSSLDL